MSDVEPPLIGGKSIEDWDRLWARVDGALHHYQPKLRHKVGLYRISRDRQIMAIGVGTDKDGGLAKRLSDFHRLGSSGRDHHAGQLIYEHRDHLDMEVLITGFDLHAREIGKQLKTPMMRLHKPVWNAANAPFMRKG